MRGASIPQIATIRCAGSRRTLTIDRVRPQVAGRICSTARRRVRSNEEGMTFMAAGRLTSLQAGNDRRVLHLHRGPEFRVGQARRDRLKVDSKNRRKARRNGGAHSTTGGWPAESIC